MCYPSQSTWPLILYRNETSYLLYTIPVQNVVRFHTGMKVLYRYENWSELIPVWLVPVQHFIPVSCKWIESYKWALEWTCASMTFRSATFGSACQYNILNWYYVNKYRATSGHWDELVPEWNSYQYHVNTPQKCQVNKPLSLSLQTVFGQITVSNSVFFLGFRAYWCLVTSWEISSTICKCELPSLGIPLSFFA